LGIYNAQFKRALYIFLFIIGSRAMAENNVEQYLDNEKLKSFRKETIISGHYLKVWDVYVQHAKNDNYTVNLDNYLIHFSENENEYIIYFKKPATQKILGGGNGTCKIKKDSMEVGECSFIK